ncbi:hypothetical protein [Guillardia theta]|uniref:Uncharacterized protein n=1 Tax=Guillardia theta TaxID=55529 RepID=Q9AW69_GUITH|nr:hypothetical protein GTHECHR2143 [Guillardia theta]CAC27001.1 hypothetical protein [Guillardia theta]
MIIDREFLQLRKYYRKIKFESSDNEIIYRKIVKIKSIIKNILINLLFFIKLTIKQPRKKITFNLLNNIIKNKINYIPSFSYLFDTISKSKIFKPNTFIQPINYEKNVILKKDILCLLNYKYIIIKTDNTSEKKKKKIYNFNNILKNKFLKNFLSTQNYSSKDKITLNFNQIVYIIDLNFNLKKNKKKVNNVNLNKIITTYSFNHRKYDETFFKILIFFVRCYVLTIEYYKNSNIKFLIMYEMILFNNSKLLNNSFYQLNKKIRYHLFKNIVNLQPKLNYFIFSIIRVIKRGLNFIELWIHPHSKTLHEILQKKIKTKSLNVKYFRFLTYIRTFIINMVK